MLFLVVCFADFENKRHTYCNIKSLWWGHIVAKKRVSWAKGWAWGGFFHISVLCNISGMKCAVKYITLQKVIFIKKNYSAFLSWFSSTNILSILNQETSTWEAKWCKTILERKTKITFWVHCFTYWSKLIQTVQRIFCIMYFKEIRERPKTIFKHPSCHCCV